MAESTEGNNGAPAADAETLDADIGGTQVLESPAFGGGSGNGDSIVWGNLPPSWEAQLVYLLLERPEYVMAAMLALALMVVLLLFRRNQRRQVGVEKRRMADKVLRWQSDFQIIFTNELKNLKTAMLKLDADKIAGMLRKMEERAPADKDLKAVAQLSEDHHMKMEERLETIAGLVKKQASGDGGDPQKTEAAMKALSEGQAQLREQLTAISASLAAKPDSGTIPIPAPAAASSSGNGHAPIVAEVQKLGQLLEKQSLYLHDELASLRGGNGAAANPSHAAGKNGGGDNGAFLEMLTQSVNRLSSEMGEKLEALNGKLEKDMGKRWSDAVASIDNLRAQIADISQTGEQMKHISKNVSSLSRLLLTRAGVGEESGRQQLGELLPQILSSEHFQLDVELPNGHSAAAMVRFPDPKDSVIIDAGMSIQPFIDTLDDSLSPGERDHKQQQFRRELATHINYVADHLILPPHTGESAMLFVPSEAAFACIHARHRAAVQVALSRRVWLVSPTTLLAVLNTANTAIRDHQANLQLQQLQATIAQIVEEAQQFEYRLTEIGDHVNSAWRSVQRAENASGRFIGSMRNIARPAPVGRTPPPPSDDDKATISLPADRDSPA